MVTCGARGRKEFHATVACDDHHRGLGLALGFSAELFLILDFVVRRCCVVSTSRSGFCIRFACPCMYLFLFVLIDIGMFHSCPKNHKGRVLVMYCLRNGPCISKQSGKSVYVSRVIFPHCFLRYIGVVVGWVTQRTGCVGGG